MANKAFYGSTYPQNDIKSPYNAISEEFEDESIPPINNHFSTSIGISVSIAFIGLLLLLGYYDVNQSLNILFSKTSSLLSTQTPNGIDLGSTNNVFTTTTNLSPVLQPTISSPLMSPSLVSPTQLLSPSIMTPLVPSTFTVASNPTSAPTVPTPSALPTAKPTLIPTVSATNPTSNPTARATISTSTSKPNFLVIVADDLGWNSLGIIDDELEFATPNLSTLTKAGITMSNFYAQEVCSPSRASLLTGRYPLTIGMQYGMVAATAEWGMSLSEITLPEVLQETANYKTHMLGKWHLGYFSPLFLPTSRGFDDFIGYVNGETYYWSKRSTDYPEFVDFMTANKTCYMPYNESDRHDYSTSFYTNKAMDIIENHDPSGDPFFLYLAYQAVHDPFVDYGKHTNGMPDSYLPSNVLTTIHTTISGRQRQEYVKSLYMLDQAIGQLYYSLYNKGILDNTYIIFMSDNGGCFYGGGKNGPLRGSKGILFEGGVKVDSFIYSPLISSSLQGTTYDGLMHISDWFPTIISLAGISYTPDGDHSLDGVDQVLGWTGQATPRSTMLYNMYTELTDYNFNIWYNGSFAVRDSRYKLIHAYNDSDYASWYDPDRIVDGDDDLASDNRCAQQFVTGEFLYWLFDLQEDPYETNNIYYSDLEEHVTAKEYLYSLLSGYSSKATKKISIHWSKWSNKYWQASGNYIIPWANEDNLQNSDQSHPVYCG